MDHHLKTDISHITFKNRDARKLNDTKKNLFIKAEHYFMLFFVIKYLWIFNMSDWSKEL